MKSFFFLGLSGLLALSPLAPAQPTPAAANPQAKAVATLKEMKRDVLKSIAEADKAEFDKKQVEAAYDRLLAAAERPLPEPRSKEGDEALAKEVIGELISLPVALTAAPMVAQPEGGSVYILGRILHNQHYTANQGDIIPLTQILFAISDPAANATYRAYVSSSGSDDRAENHLKFLLTIMNIGDGKVFEEGKALLGGDRAKLQEWLLDVTKQADFKNEKALRDYRSFLRKKP